MVIGDVGAVVFDACVRLLLVAIVVSVENVVDGDGGNELVVVSESEVESNMRER